MRDAESMLDQLLSSAPETIDERRVRDLLGLADAEAVDGFVDALVAGDAATGIALLDGLEERGRDAGRLLDQAIDAHPRPAGRGARPAGDGSATPGLADAARRLAAHRSRPRRRRRPAPAARARPLRHGGSSLPARWPRSMASGRRSSVLRPRPRNPHHRGLRRALRAGAPAPAARVEAPTPPSTSPDVAPPEPVTPPPADSASVAQPPDAPPPDASAPDPERRPPCRPRSGQSKAEPVVSPAAGDPTHRRPRQVRPRRGPRPRRPSTPRRRSSGAGQRPAPRRDGLAALLAAWPDVVARLSADPPTKPFIIACRPVAVDGAIVTLGFPEEQSFLKDATERRRAKIEAGDRRGPRPRGDRPVRVREHRGRPAAATLSRRRPRDGRGPADLRRRPRRRRRGRLTAAARTRRIRQTDDRRPAPKELSRWAWPICSGWPSRCSRRCCGSRPSSSRRSSTARPAAASSRRQVTGKQELVSVTIDPSAVDPADVEMLQDLVVAAVNDALRASRELAEQKMAAVTGGLRLPGM